MASAEEVFVAVSDLMRRGHFAPDSLSLLRETAPRPPSESDKFLPGQRVSYFNGKEAREDVIIRVAEWDRSEAAIVERPWKALKGEMVEWKLSELSPGTVRVTVEVQGRYGPLEHLSKKANAKKFYGEMLRRLKSHLEDRRSFAGPNTFAPKS